MKLGTYPLGKQKIIVHTNMSGDGSFSGDQVTIGMDHNWAETVNVCLHELLEMCCSDHGCRLGPDVDFGNSNDCYTFIMTHPQFAQIVGSVALCLVHLLPDLAKAHNAENPDIVPTKPRRKRPKRSQPSSGVGDQGGGLGDSKV